MKHFRDSLLKKYDGPTPASPVPLPALLNGKVLQTPEKIMKAQLNMGVWEILV
jgi:hypothetical protein